VSHPEQLAFFGCVARANGLLVSGARVLEIGAYDVNGSVRQLFAGAKDYTGVDLIEGPGVDVVAYGHQLSDPDGSYDLTLSGECFEHDEHWPDTFTTMCRLTRPGGLVVVTCASTGRPEHGTRRTDQKESPGTQARGLDYYRNLTEQDFRALPGFGSWFKEHLFSYNPTSFDLYFVGVKSGPADAPVGSLPDPAALTCLKWIMPMSHRMARVPLRLMLRVLPERWYREVAFRYWRLLVAVARRLGLLVGRAT